MMLYSNVSGALPSANPLPPPPHRDGSSDSGSEEGRSILSELLPCPVSSLPPYPRQHLNPPCSPEGIPAAAAPGSPTPPSSLPGFYTPMGEPAEGGRSYDGFGGTDLRPAGPRRSSYPDSSIAINAPHMVQFIGAGERRGGGATAAVQSPVTKAGDSVLEQLKQQIQGLTGGAAYSGSSRRTRAYMCAHLHACVHGRVCVGRCESLRSTSSDAGAAATHVQPRPCRLLCLQATWTAARGGKNSKRSRRGSF